MILELHTKTKINKVDSDTLSIAELKAMGQHLEARRRLMSEKFALLTATEKTSKVGVVIKSIID